MGTVVLFLPPHCDLLGSCPTVGSQLHQCHHHPHQSRATNPTSETGLMWEGRGKTWLGQTDEKALNFSELQPLQEVSLRAEQSIWFSLSLNALLQFEGVLFAKPEN